MKILHLIPHYLPSTEFGGSPQSTHQMVREQVKQGHQVDVLTTDIQGAKKRSPLKEEQHPDGYRIFRVANISTSLAYHAKFHIAPGAVSFLWKHLPEYDVIHFHEYRTTLNVVAALLKWRTQAQYILQAHGLYLNFGGRHGPKEVFDFFFKKILDKSVDKVIAISQKELKQLQTVFPSQQLYLVYHGIAVAKTAAVQNSTPELKLPSLFILFVGRLHKTKRIDFLLKAYAKSGLAKRQIEVVIAGNDEGELSELKRLAAHLKVASHVHFLNAVDNVQKNLLYQNALLTAYVTADEPFGRVPIEAAMQGCWSILSEDSGVAELTNMAKFASVISGKTIKEFSECLVEDITARKRVRKAAQRTLAQMTWKKQARGLQMVYKQPVTGVSLGKQPATQFSPAV
jgi:glycosyltransferase involved in cell wall biosynthesis